MDADPAQRRSLAGIIRDAGKGRFSPLPCASPDEVRAALGSGDAIVIADLDTLGGPARVSDVAMPVIATSANSSLGTAVSAVKSGAIDFLPKPIGAKVLLDRLEAALHAFTTRAPASPILTPPAAGAVRPAGLAGETDFAGFIGRSEPMRAVYEQVKRIAPSRAPVFITGESGTGKELTAEAIHAYSGREGHPFVAINCSAIPKDLMESEIFGHLKGAFTGASDHRVGAAERADGGTLFLDEIAEMELSLQAKLLRFLQTGTVQRVGGSEAKAVDVRIVCATNRDPAAEVDAGRFRADLFYRLHVLPIHLAPLRERREDVLPVAEAFLARYAAEEQRRFRRFADEAANRLVAFDWPGNVRQLANAIRRIVVLNDGDEVSVDMLPASIAGNQPAVQNRQPNSGSATPLPLWQEERRAIESALATFDGNIARAAAALEISPSTIYRKRQAWEARSRMPR
jgi:two-component system repressor protein LuxO